MERLTRRWMSGIVPHKCGIGCSTYCDSCSVGSGNCHDAHDMIVRLASIEDILGNDYSLYRLRQLVEADRDGRCVVFKFGMGSTVYRTWVRPGGECPFVSVHLIKTVDDLVNAEKWDNAYATREEAEQALRGIAENGT